MYQSCLHLSLILHRLFLRTILPHMTLLPQAVPFICLSSTNLAHLFLDLCPFLQPSLLFVTPLPPVRSSRLPAPSFQPCQFLPPYLPLSVRAVTPPLPLSLLSSPYPSLLCHPLLSFVFTPTSIFIHLSPSLSLSSPLPHPFFAPLWTFPLFLFCPQSLSLLSYPAVSSLRTCLSFWIHSFMY